MKTQENHESLGAVTHTHTHTHTHKHFYRKDTNYLETTENNSNKIKPKNLTQITVGAISNHSNSEGIQKNILSNNRQNIKPEYRNITKQNCRGEQCSSGSEGMLIKQKETAKNNKKIISKNQKTETKIKEAGITLVALVITIIILIILARSNNKFDFKAKWNIRTNANCKSANQNSTEQKKRQD